MINLVGKITIVRFILKLEMMLFLWWSSVYIYYAIFLYLMAIPYTTFSIASRINHTIIPNWILVLACDIIPIFLICDITCVVLMEKLYDDKYLREYLIKSYISKLKINNDPLVCRKIYRLKNSCEELWDIID